MDNESKEVYQNEIKEFDEAVEVYRKKSKADKRRAIIFPLLFFELDFLYRFFLPFFLL